MIGRLKDATKSWRRNAQSERQRRLFQRLSAAWSACKDLRYVTRVPGIIRHLQRQRCDASQRTVADLVATVFDDFGGFLRPFQMPDEITMLMGRLMEDRPRVVVEIGTARGGTLFLWCRAAREDAVVVSIDLPGGWFGGGYPFWRTWIYRKFARTGQALHLLRADSHAAATLERVKRYLGGRPIDFLMIDGDHTTAGVRQDFAAYAPLVGRGGFVAFHDILPSVLDPDIGVHILWQELKDRYPSWEYVQDRCQGRMGIGLLRL